MITRMLSQRLVLLVIGLAAGSGILIPAGYASFHPVTSSEIQNETIQSVDIKDGEVKAADIATSAVGAAEIATDAVGAAELQGVTKLLFGQCMYTNAEKSKSILATVSLQKSCNIAGVDSDDSAFATLNHSSLCFVVSQVSPSIDAVIVSVNNICPFTQALGTHAKLAVLVYDK